MPGEKAPKHFKRSTDKDGTMVIIDSRQGDMASAHFSALQKNRGKRVFPDGRVVNYYADTNPSEMCVRRRSLRVI